MYNKLKEPFNKLLGRSGKALLVEIDFTALNNIKFVAHLKLQKDAGEGEKSLMKLKPIVDFIANEIKKKRLPPKIDTVQFDYDAQTEEWKCIVVLISVIPMKKLFLVEQTGEWEYEKAHSRSG